MSALKKAVELDPKDVFANHNLGCALNELNRPDAEVVYNHDIDYTLDKPGKLDDAVLVAVYKEAIESNQHDLFSHYCLAQIFAKQKKPDEARKHYQIAADLGYTNARKKLAEFNNSGAK